MELTHNNTLWLDGAAATLARAVGFVVEFVTNPWPMPPAKMIEEEVVGVNGLTVAMADRPPQPSQEEVDSIRRESRTGDRVHTRGKDQGYSGEPGAGGRRTSPSGNRANDDTAHERAN